MFGVFTTTVFICHLIGHAFGDPRDPEIYCNFSRGHVMATLSREAERVRPRKMNMAAADYCRVLV